MQRKYKVEFRGKRRGLLRALRINAHWILQITAANATRFSCKMCRKGWTDVFEKVARARYWFFGRWDSSSFFPFYLFFFCLGSQAFKIESRRVRVCLPASKKFSNGCRRSCIGELRSDAAEHKLFADRRSSAIICNEFASRSRWDEYKLLYQLHFQILRDVCTWS